MKHNNTFPDSLLKMYLNESQSTSNPPSDATRPKTRPTAVQSVGSLSMVSYLRFSVVAKKKRREGPTGCVRIVR